MKRDSSYVVDQEGGIHDVERGHGVLKIKYPKIHQLAMIRCFSCNDGIPVTKVVLVDRGGSMCHGLVVCPWSYLSSSLFLIFSHINITKEEVTRPKISL